MNEWIEEKNVTLINIVCSFKTTKKRNTIQLYGKQPPLWRGEKLSCETRLEGMQSDGERWQVAEMKG